MPPVSSLRPLIFLIFLGSSWGFYFSLLKIAVHSGISYIGIVTLATLGVGAGMSLIAFFRGRKPGWSRHHHVFYLVCALSGYLIPMLVEVWVIGHMPAGVLTLIVSMAPLVTLALAWLLNTDRVDLARGPHAVLSGVAFTVRSDHQIDGAVVQMQPPTIGQEVRLRPHQDVSSFDQR